MPTARPTTPPEERAVVRQAISVSVATGLYGISLGALAVVAGLSVWQAVVLSLVMFSGGSQFALVGIVGTGGSAASAIATAGVLGIRNGFYGVQLSPLLAVRSWRRVLAAHLTIDESTAVATAQPTVRLARLGFWLTGAGVFVLWNVFVLAGALAGNALGDPKRYGLDAAASAAFLALLWPRLRTPVARVVAVGAVVVAVVLTPVVPSGVPVLVAAALAVVVGWRVRPEERP
ncbi:AzlC family ABC transporter permease [Luteimicrobium sp. DT211]|uniref:AzlC family ABC transporter permease n=1 Tax=Luteimicrobium sp. DT211 TaxID=3393412 RepID=UPI003CEFF268